MARSINRLSALGARKQTRPGLYHDGGGLYLQIGGSGSKSWTYRYMLAGKAREMGLGPFRIVSLADTREKAAEASRLRLAGIDPIAARNNEVLKARVGRESTKTFMDCGRQYIESHRAEWKNEKHGAQWQATLDTYVGPVFGDSPVQDINLTLIMRVLEPIWTTKTETASRIRGRIERILDWATTAGYRRGENPARWRGHLENLLPQAVQSPQGHAPSGTALCGGWFFRHCATGIGRYRAGRIRLLDPDCGADKRGPGRSLGRGRP